MPWVISKVLAAVLALLRQLDLSHGALSEHSALVGKLPGCTQGHCGNHNVLLAGLRMGPKPQEVCPVPNQEAGVPGHES